MPHLSWRTEGAARWPLLLGGAALLLSAARVPAAPGGQEPGESGQPAAGAASPVGVVAAALFQEDPVAAVQALLEAGGQALSRVETYRGYLFEQERQSGRGGERLGPWEVRDVVAGSDGRIRMRWVEGPHKGCIALWNPEANAGRVRVRQAGLGPFFVVRDLEPDSRSRLLRGHQGVVGGGLLGDFAREQRLVARGVADGQLGLRYLGLGRDEAPDGSERAPILCHTYERWYRSDTMAPAPYGAGRVKVWLDAERGIPVKFEEYDETGQVLRRRAWSRVRLDPMLGDRPEITDADFDPATVRSH